MVYNKQISIVNMVPITKKHPELEQLASWRNLSLISLRSISPTDPNNQEEWVDQFTKRGDKYYFIYTTTNVLIGYCGFDKIDLYNKTAEMSLLIATGHDQFKYGKISVQKLLTIGFVELQLNCIFIEVYQTTSNWTFWKECGFRKEGLLRSRKYWNGKFYDSIIASMLADEFNF